MRTRTMKNRRAPEASPKSGRRRRRDEEDDEEEEERPKRRRKVVEGETKKVSVRAAAL